MAPVPWLQRFFSALGDWISSIYQEEKKYVDQLESIKDCLTLCHNNVGEDEKIRELDAKDKEKVAELQDKLSSSKDSKYGDSDHQAYLLEQIIMLLVKTDPKNPFAKYKKETREAYDEKVRKIKLVDQVRADYSRQCFIGVIGPQNAGKSTLLNTVFNQNAETGKRKHNMKPTLYPLLNRTYVIDFPGSNALDIPGSVFQTLGEMNNLDRLRQHRRLVPGHQTIKSSNGKRFPGPYSYSFHYFSGFPMVDLVMILGHNLK